MHSFEEPCPKNNVQTREEQKPSGSLRMGSIRKEVTSHSSPGSPSLALLQVFFLCINLISHKPTALNTKQGGEAKSKAQSLPFIFEVFLSVSVSRCGLSNAPDF